MAGASTLTNVSKSPLNNLALYCERGLGFLCFWGLGGTFGGLREGNIITEQGRNQTTNKTPISHIKITKQGFRVPSPPHPRGKRVLPLSYAFTFTYALQTIQATHPDHFFLACCSPHLFAGLFKNGKHLPGWRGSGGWRVLPYTERLLRVPVPVQALGLIPGQDACRRQLRDVSHSAFPPSFLPFSLPLSLKSIINEKKISVTKWN